MNMLYQDSNYLDLQDESDAACEAIYAHLDSCPECSGRRTPSSIYGPCTIYARLSAVRSEVDNKIDAITARYDDQMIRDRD